jgi:hypothetical protein
MKGKFQMTKFVAGLTAISVICAAASVPASAAAEVDKAVLQKATADCKAQVKKYAQYNETSWYQRHKMVKSCIKDALEKK